MSISKFQQFPLDCSLIHIQVFKFLKNFKTFTHQKIMLLVLKSKLILICEFWFIIAKLISIKYFVFYSTKSLSKINPISAKFILKFAGLSSLPYLAYSLNYQSQICPFKWLHILSCLRVLSLRFEIAQMLFLSIDRLIISIEMNTRHASKSAL